MYLIAYSLHEAVYRAPVRAWRGALHTSLDRVERRSHGDRCDGARNRRNEVLAPGRLVVVLDAEEVILRHGRSTEELPRSSEDSTR